MATESSAMPLILVLDVTHAAWWSTVETEVSSSRVIEESDAPVARRLSTVNQSESQMAFGRFRPFPPRFAAARPACQGSFEMGPVAIV